MSLLKDAEERGGFDDESLERELFATRRAEVIAYVHAHAGADADSEADLERGVGDVLARIDEKAKVSRRGRRSGLGTRALDKTSSMTADLMGVVRVLSQAGTALAAAAACIALVRGLPPERGESHGSIIRESSSMRVSAKRSASSSADPFVKSNALACGASGTSLSSGDNACEASSASVQPASVQPASAQPASAQASVAQLAPTQPASPSNDDTTLAQPHKTDVEANGEVCDEAHGELCGGGESENGAHGVLSSPAARDTLSCAQGSLQKTLEATTGDVTCGAFGP